MSQWLRLPSALLATVVLGVSATAAQVPPLEGSAQKATPDEALFVLSTPGLTPPGSPARVFAQEAIENIHLTLTKSGSLI